MLIPHTHLNSETLNQLMEDYVTREGTDNGQFTTTTERKAELLGMLENETVFITYNHQYQQACLIPRHEASPEALLIFSETKGSFNAAADQECELKAEAEFQRLYAEMQAAGTFPISLGRTIQTRGVHILQQENRLTLDALQDLLRKHSLGDYGLVCWSDKLKNLLAIVSKDYMLSRYEVNGHSLCVEMLTGHSQAMVRLTSEY